MKKLICTISLAIMTWIPVPSLAGERNANIREACEIIVGVGALITGAGTSSICGSVAATDQAVVCRRKLLDAGYTRSKAFLECSRKYRSEIFGN
tara:strand:- start:23550 stop:23831 length:282 start_codon:yes stop_codon:yes gene_type:complete